MIQSPIILSPVSPVLSAEDISESVNRMAESFVHDELDSTRTYNLQSTHRDTSYSPPGTFDEDVIVTNNDEELAVQGVSLIATLIEKLLSRFKFDISDIHIKVVFPGKSTLIFNLEHVLYRTEDVVGRTVDESQVDKGEARMLSFGGISVSMKTFFSSVDTLSLSSASSDNDDENMNMMSQSLAALPPRPGSPPRLEASLYHSVLSTLLEEKTPSLPRVQENEEQKLLSLGHGTESVVITMTTPALHVSSDTFSSTKPRVSLSISVSPILLSLNPSQVAILLQIFSLVHKADSPTLAVSKPPSRASFDDWTLNINLRDMNCILSNSPIMLMEQRIINDFHLQYPASRELRFPHLRLSFNSLCIRVNSMTYSKPEFHDHQAHFQGHLEDIYILFFSYENDDDLLISPVLICDWNLKHQYHGGNDTLPVFDIAKWTKSSDISKASKASFWRYHSSQPPNTEPVLRIQTHIFPGEAIEIDVIPLHIYADIGTLQFVSSYLNDVADLKPATPEGVRQVSSETTEITSSTYVDESSVSTYVQPYLSH